MVLSAYGDATQLNNSLLPNPGRNKVLQCIGYRFWNAMGSRSSFLA
uniref:Uncharacterized protein n=1 Tax=Anguilla anguilla TaxID=7936 RepID=A0A0E9Q4J5_ANGAN